MPRQLSGLARFFILLFQTVFADAQEPVEQINS